MSARVLTKRRRIGGYVFAAAYVAASLLFGLLPLLTFVALIVAVYLAVKAAPPQAQAGREKPTLGAKSLQAIKTGALGVAAFFTAMIGAGSIATDADIHDCSVNVEDLMFGMGGLIGASRAEARCANEKLARLEIRQAEREAAAAEAAKPLKFEGEGEIDDEQSALRDAIARECAPFKEEQACLLLAADIAPCYSSPATRWTNCKKHAREDYQLFKAEGGEALKARLAERLAARQNEIEAQLVSDDDALDALFEGCLRIYGIGQQNGDDQIGYCKYFIESQPAADMFLAALRDCVRRGGNLATCKERVIAEVDWDYWL